MTDPMEPHAPEWITSFRAAAARLAAHRRRPCLIFHTASIRRRLILDVRRALAGATLDPLDVVVSSPGGDIDAAYVIARELRRQGGHVTVYVPLTAKSAATLLCLAADELVLGSLGELGPLDAQYDEKQKADFPVTLSRLAPFTALAQLKDGVMAFYDEAVGRIVQRSGMRPFEACSQAAELTSAVYRTIYQQIDPNRLAESARGLEIGCEYGVRVLRRYRPDVFAKDGEQLIHRLVHAYPSHGFVVDLEELAELGLPARAAEDGAERDAVEALAEAIIEAPEDVDADRDDPPRGEGRRRRSGSRAGQRHGPRARGPRGPADGDAVRRERDRPRLWRRARAREAPAPASHDRRPSGSGPRAGPGRRAARVSGHRRLEARMSPLGRVALDSVTRTCLIVIAAALAWLAAATTVGPLLAPSRAEAQREAVSVNLERSAGATCPVAPCPSDASPPTRPRAGRTSWRARLRHAGEARRGDAAPGRAENMLRTAFRSWIGLKRRSGRSGDRHTCLLKAAARSSE